MPSPIPIPPPPSPKQMVLATEDWVEYRTGFPTLVRKFLFRKVPPTGWFHTLGSSLLTVFIIQATTGALLAMTYDPSPNGAYESIRYITDVQTLGWLIRGMHKWGASVMVILLFLHMGRTFFYGAYKYPREMTWLTGSLIFISVMGMGLTGYLLVWDERAYWASVVAININGTAPVLGPFISKFLLGGPVIGAQTISRFYALHMLLIPGAIIALIFVHMWLVVKLGVTPWPARPPEPEPAPAHEPQPQRHLDAPVAVPVTAAEEQREVQEVGGD
jgi:quinol-cytochrome oxidoreductase complex cytochrome b subunit